MWAWEVYFCACCLPLSQGWVMHLSWGVLCSLIMCCQRALLQQHCLLLCEGQPMAQPQRAALLPLHIARRLPWVPFCHGSVPSSPLSQCVSSESTLQICMLFFFFWAFWQRQSGEAFSWWWPKSYTASHTCLLWPHM